MHTQFTAVQTAAAVRSGRMTAKAAVEAALSRIAALDPDLNAFSVVRQAEAVAEAQAIDAGGPGYDGPLAGVPIAVKEEYDVAGLVTTLGGYGNSTPAAADSEVIRRVRAAGAVIVAKTTMPEFGQVPFTDSVRYGPTRNPFDMARYPGGSSGGSAVAVATGTVPLALGADGGGSLRIPAGACGLVGLKPTRGRVSLAPLAQHWYSLVVLGGLSRTVADSALLLDVISGSTPTDRWQLPDPERSFVDAAASAPGQLRVVWTTRPVVPGVRTDPQVAAVVERFAERLSGLGHHVTRISPRWPAITPAFLAQFHAGMATEAGQVEHPDLLEPSTRATVRLARWAGPSIVERAVRQSQNLADVVDRRIFGDANVVVLPTMPLRTPRVGLLDQLGPIRANLRTSGYIANTALANVTGHPAISVPGGYDNDGLPVGVQIIGPRGAEDILLSLANQIVATTHKR